MIRTLVENVDVEEPGQISLKSRTKPAQAAKSQRKAELADAIKIYNKSLLRIRKLLNEKDRQKTEYKSHNI